MNVTDCCTNAVYAFVENTDTEIMLIGKLYMDYSSVPSAKLQSIITSDARRYPGMFYSEDITILSEGRSVEELITRYAEYFI